MARSPSQSCAPCWTGRCCRQEFSRHRILIRPRRAGSGTECQINWFIGSLIHIKLGGLRLKLQLQAVALRTCLVRRFRIDFT